MCHVSALPRAHSSFIISHLGGMMREVSRSCKTVKGTFLSHSSTAAWNDENRLLTVYLDVTIRTFSTLARRCFPCFPMSFDVLFEDICVNGHSLISNN